MNAFTSYYTIHDIDLSKVYCVTTDDVAAMVGNKKGFIKLLENYVGRKLLNFHCTIHQESLCAKTSSLNLGAVMTTVVKIVNYLVSHSSLVHRKFKSLFKEIDCEYGDLLLHSNVRLLSRGKHLHVVWKLSRCFLMKNKNMFLNWKMKIDY